MLPLVVFVGAVALLLMLFFGDRDEPLVGSGNIEEKTDKSNTQRPTDMVSYCMVLGIEIQEGDPIESVEQRLGPGTPLDPEQHNRIVQVVANWQSSDPDTCRAPLRLGGSPPDGRG